MKPRSKPFKIKWRSALSSSFFIALVLSSILHTIAIFPLLQRTSLEKSKSAESIEIIMNQPSDESTQAASSRLATSSDIPTDVLSGGFSRQHLANIGTYDTDTYDTGTSNPGDQPHFTDDPMTAVGPTSHGWSGAVQFGNAMGLKHTLETLSYFEAIHHRVNGQLVYPDDFARHRITGKVRIEAELGKDGRLIRFLSTTADDRLLQTYCFAVLMQILKNPIPKGAWLEKERAIVAFDFEFHVRIPNETPRLFPRGIEKNRLAFFRENEIDPWLNEKIDEILTHYVPPIIPLPGGFYVDLIRAYEFVNNLIEGTPTESEQRQARIEKLHELLRTTVREQKPSPTPPLNPET